MGRFFNGCQGIFFILWKNINNYTQVGLLISEIIHGKIKKKLTKRPNFFSSFKLDCSTVTNCLNSPHPGLAKLL